MAQSLNTWSLLWLSRWSYVGSASWIDSWWPLFVLGLGIRDFPPRGFVTYEDVLRRGNLRIVIEDSARNADSWIPILNQGERGSAHLAEVARDSL